MQPKFVTPVLKFEKSEGKHPVTGLKCVEFVCGANADVVLDRFTIRATEEGIQFFGHSPVITGKAHLEPLAKFIGEAFKAHYELLNEAEGAQSEKA